MVIFDGKDNSEIKIGDVVCRMDDESLWKLVGFKHDIVGKECAILKPVRYPEEWLHPIPDNDVFCDVWKI